MQDPFELLKKSAHIQCESECGTPEEEDPYIPTKEEAAYLQRAAEYQGREHRKYHRFLYPSIAVPETVDSEFRVIELSLTGVRFISPRGCTMTGSFVFPSRSSG